MQIGAIKTPYKVPAPLNSSREPPISEDRNSKVGNKTKTKLAVFSKVKIIKLAS